MKTYYVSQSGQRVGPFSIEQLAQLYQNGTLNDDATVIEREGSTRLRLIDLLAPPKPSRASVDLDALVAQIKEPTLTVDNPDDDDDAPFVLPSRSRDIYELATMPAQLITKLVDRWRDALQNVDKLRDLWALIGHLSLIVVVALLTLGGLWVGFKEDSFKLLLLAWGGALTLVFFQYIALNALNACQSLIDRAQIQKSNTIVYDALGMLSLFVGFIGCVMLLVNALDHHGVEFGPMTSSLAIFVLGGVFSVYLMTTTAALNPHLVNVVDVEAASVAEEALSLFAWHIKLWLYLAPVFYGVINLISALSATLIMLLLAKVDWAKPALETLGYLWFNTSFNSSDGYALLLIYFGALSPLFIYLFALLMHLNVDFIYAVVSMTKRRLDR